MNTRVQDQRTITEFEQDTHLLTWLEAACGNVEKSPQKSHPQPLGSPWMGGKLENILPKIASYLIY